MTEKIATVDPEFAALCPELTKEERTFLENSILAEGCRDPVIAWDSAPYPILDGHNRRDICLSHELDFLVVLKKFSTRNAAKNWIIRNQLGRRNVSEEQRAYLRGKLCQSRERQPQPTGSERVDSLSIAYSAAAQVAAEEHVSEKTVRRDRDFAASVDKLAEKSPELAQAARRGEIPKSQVAAVAELPPEEIKEIEDTPARARKRTIRRKTATTTTPEPEAAGASSADTAKAQIKIWSGTIGRWLGTSVSIDELRAQFPGPRGDEVLAAAKELYESLIRWHKAIH